MKDPIVLFDMDNTLFDYEGEMVRCLNSIASPQETVMERLPSRAPVWLERRMDFIKRQPGFWVHLPMLRDGFQILNEVSQYTRNIHILTKGPTRTHSAWTEKVECCRARIPQAKITITEDKSLQYGKMLVDDWPPYCLAWLEHRPNGLVVLPDRHYNKDFKHPQVIRAVMTDQGDVLQTVRLAIQDFLTK